MASRTRYLITHGATSGALDLSTYDGSTRWWIGMRLKLHALADQLVNEVVRSDAQRVFHLQANFGITPESAREIAEAAQTRVRNAFLPWLADEGVDNSPEHQNEAIAMWYAAFGKEFGVL